MQNGGRDGGGMIGFLGWDLNTMMKQDKEGYKKRMC